MKKVIFILAAMIFTLTFTSCGSVTSASQYESEVAGYTLKNKKELMQQKILNKNSKIVIVTP